MAELLLIVERDRPDLYNYLTWHFSSEKEVQVIVERRGTERRLSVRPREPERREVNRRRQPSVRRDPLSLDHVITRRLGEEIASNEITLRRLRPIRPDWSGRDGEIFGGSSGERSSVLAGFARPPR